MKRKRDLIQMNLDWTPELKEEIRERHLRQNKFYVLASTVILVPSGILGGYAINKYLYLIPVIYYFRCITDYILLKKLPWIQMVSWIILFWDLAMLTAVAWLLGAPHYTSAMIVYPIVMVLYCIYVHPAIASRFFIISMGLLGGLIWLTLTEKVPHYPLLQLIDQQNAKILSEYFIRSDISTVYATGTFIVFVLINLVALMAINFVVYEARFKTGQITRLSEKLKVYLPHQFVDSLASEERDIHPDYRRKRLTIFFSDVKGFTAWTDNLEPEEVREILDRYLSEMSRIIHKWGGTIDKFIGDAIMVFYGDPEFTSDKDHALRCTKMAMEMQEKMAELRNEWEGMGYEKPLQIRIGINTGFATVGNFGSDERLDYTALGSAVNLASRLETASRPDKITISHTTYSFVKDEIDCAPMGEITVKGFSEPVKIYEVVGLLNPSA